MVAALSCTSFLARNDKLGEVVRGLARSRGARSRACSGGWWGAVESRLRFLQPENNGLEAIDVGVNDGMALPYCDLLGGDVAMVAKAVGL